MAYQWSVTTTTYLISNSISLTLFSHQQTAIYTNGITIVCFAEWPSVTLAVLSVIVITTALHQRFIEVLPVSTIIDCICINFVHDPCWVNKQWVRGRRKIPKTSNLARVENTHLIGWRKRDCIDIYMKIMADLRWPGSNGPLFKGLTFHLKRLTPKMVTCQK